MEQDELKKIRQEIDKIDEDIVELLSKRAICAKNAARLKNSLELPLRDKIREEEVLGKLYYACKDKEISYDALKNIYIEIMKQMRRIEGEE